MYVYACIYMCMCVYKHIHTHTQTHTHKVLEEKPSHIKNVTVKINTSYKVQERNFYHMRKKLWKFFTLITFNLQPICWLHSVHLIFECLQNSVTHLWWVPSTTHNMHLFKSCTHMTGLLHVPHRKLCPWGLNQKIF
jgi:hypothetical protein